MYEQSRYSKENLSSIVVDYVKDNILMGALKSGDRITENKLSEDLDISRAPVREALRALEKEGLITVLPRKGAHVSAFGKSDIKEIFDIRLSLESDIFKILIEENLLTGSDIAFLTQKVDEMVAVSKSSKDEVDKMMSINMIDMAFHTFLWKKSGSIRRVKILRDMFFQLRMAILYDTRLTDDLYLTASDHYNIIESLRNKDLTACKKYLKAHIISYRDDPD